MFATVLDTLKEIAKYPSINRVERTPFDCRIPGYDCTLQIDEGRPNRTSPLLFEYLSVIQAAKMLPY